MSTETHRPLVVQGSAKWISIWMISTNDSFEIAEPLVRVFALSVICTFIAHNFLSDATSVTFLNMLCWLSLCLISHSFEGFCVFVLWFRDPILTEISMTMSLGVYVCVFFSGIPSWLRFPWKEKLCVSGIPSWLRSPWMCCCVVFVIILLVMFQSF
jgi:hypothetical protein